MSEKLILDFIGQPNSGKSTAISYVESLGFDTVKPSAMIAAHAPKYNLPLRSRQDYATVHRHMIADDPEVMVRPAIESESLLVAYDGLRILRHMDMLRAYASKTPGVTVALIALVCPWDIRLAREHENPDPKWNHEPLTEAAFFRNEIDDYFNTNIDEPNVVPMMAEADIRIATYDESEIWLPEVKKAIDYLRA